jgi:hypothetical protein
MSEETVKGVRIGDDYWRNVPIKNLGVDIDELKRIAERDAPARGGKRIVFIPKVGMIVSFDLGEVGDPDFPNVPEPEERPIKREEIPDEVWKALGEKQAEMLSMIGTEMELEVQIPKDRLATWLGYGERSPTFAELREEAERTEEDARDLLYEASWSDRGDGDL